MTSRIDLIKSILRNSDAYTQAQLEKIPDEELVMIKLKAEAKSLNAGGKRFKKNIVVGKNRNKLLRREWRMKKK